MRIREAKAADIPALAELAARTFPLACPPQVPPADVQAFIAANLSAERFGEYLGDPERLIILADDGGRLSGYTMLVTGEPADAHIASTVRSRPTIELSKCYVAPDELGSGVAALLVEDTISRCAKLEAVGIWLGVNRLNVRAQRFYAKHGFELVGTRRFTVGGRVEDDLVLECRLT